MSILTRLKSWLWRSLPLRGDLSAWEEAGLLRRSESGVRVTTEKALGHAPLWRGLQLLSNVPMRLPLHVYQDTADNSHRRAVEHPAYRLLRRRPNRWMTAATFKKLLTYHAVFFGNGYAHIIRDRREAGNPLEMIPLDPQLTKPVQEDGALWYRTGENRDDRLPAEDVLHLKGLSHDGLEGLSVIHLLADAIGMGLAAREFAAKFFKEGVQASGIFAVEGLDYDAQLQATKDFAALVGPNSKHKVAVVSGGKFIPISVNPEQAQMLQTRAFEDSKTIANVLGLPPHLLGDDSKSSYASLEQENASLLSNSYDPILVGWEAEIDAKLLRDGEGGYFAEFKREALLRTDTATQYEAYTKGRMGGWLSVNDIRRSLNLPGIGPQGDIYLSPSNMVPADQAGSRVDETKDALRSAITDRLERARRLPANVAQEKRTEALRPLLRAWEALTGVAPVFDPTALTLELKEEPRVHETNGRH